MEKEIKASLNFWNEAYLDYHPTIRTNDEWQVLEAMKPSLEIFASNCDSILDFGCGTGDLALLIAKNYKINKILGVENGENIVRYASENAKINMLENKVTIKDGGLNYINTLNSMSFDGIIVSNVLDVVTNDVAEDIMKELVRVLKSKGFMLLKINPDITKAKLLERGFDNFKENLFAKNGVLRLRLLTTTQWQTWLSKWFEEISLVEVPWQAPNALDRLFLLRKKD